MASESWCEGTNVPTVRILMVGEERMRSTHWLSSVLHVSGSPIGWAQCSMFHSHPLVEVSASCFRPTHWLRSVFRVSLPPIGWGQCSVFQAHPLVEVSAPCFTPTHWLRSVLHVSLPPIGWAQCSMFQAHLLVEVSAPCFTPTHWLRSVLHVSLPPIGWGQCFMFQAHPLVEVNAPCFLQCFVAICWVTRRTSGPKYLVSLTFAHVAFSRAAQCAAVCWGRVEFDSMHIPNVTKSLKPQEGFCRPQKVLLVIPVPRISKILTWTTGEGIPMGTGWLKFTGTVAVKWRLINKWVAVNSNA